MNWFILPFITEYLRAAEFTVQGKIVRALKSNIPYYIIYLVLFVILIVVLSFSTAGRASLARYHLYSLMYNLII
jgi:LMBR1-like membrane protein